MASNATHYFFGRRILRLLPHYLQDIIIGYGKHFDIGQQGPDPLFFHFPNNKKAQRSKQVEPGNFIHKQSLEDFYLRNKHHLDSLPLDSAGWVYFLGFVCHFSLDICIHKEIRRIKKDLSLDHLSMEKELDRQILLEEGLDPRKFLSRNTIPHPREVARQMAPFYQSYDMVDLAIIKESLFYFRIAETLLHIPGPSSQKKKEKILALLKLKKNYQGKIMTIEPREEAKYSTPHLRKAFEDALPLARNLILYFISEPKPQEKPSQILLNFNGVKITQKSKKA